MQISLKLNIQHLALRLILFAGLAYLILNYISIFLIWEFVGDGKYPKSWDIYIDAIYGLSAIVVLFPFLIYRIVVNYKRVNMAKANDYVIVGITILLVSALFYIKNA